MSYGRIHRFLLRTVGSRGVITMAETLRILAEYTDNECDPVQDLVKEINSVIRPLQQKIKITHDELTDEEVLVYISMIDDDISKAQNYFTATELEYFRVLLEQIITTDSRQVTRIHALNLVGSMKSSFTKTEAEKLLKKWCKMRYLDKDESNYILGLRTIHEFESYFRHNMPDAVEECCLCKTIVFRGYNCPSCSLAIHTRCLNRYVKNVPKWPCCKTDYSSEQLENLNCENSRLTQSQRSSDTSHSPTQRNTEATVMQVTQEITQDIEAQEIIPEISQRITRKRKHQC